MEATTEKNEYKLKDFLLDVFAKYKINIKKQDFDTILILEEDNKEFRAGRDLEEKEERYYASSDIKKPDFPDLRQLPAKEKYVFENENFSVNRYSGNESFQGSRFWNCSGKPAFWHSEGALSGWCNACIFGNHDTFDMVSLCRSWSCVHHFRTYDG